MQRYLMLFAGALLFMAGLGLAPVVSQDMGGDECAGEDKDTESSDPMVEAWKKLHTPGEHHEVLKKMEGDWDMAMTMWMEHGAEPVKTESETSLEMDFGGRFLRGSYEMKGSDFPHTGETLYGYSASSKKYQYIRITDMDTNMRVYEGDYDAEKNQLTVKAEYKMNWGGMELDVRERNVYTFESDDKFTLEVWTTYVGLPDMPEEGIREMQIVYTRKQN